MCIKVYEYVENELKYAICNVKIMLISINYIVHVTILKKNTKKIQYLLFNYVNNELLHVFK